MPRQLHVALALALLGLALCAEAAQLTWTGCNTDFNNPKNWAAAQKVPWTRATGESPATTVDVGRSTRINDPTAGVNTFVEQGVYKMHELIFPENGVLTLSSDGTELEFYDASETEGTANFIADSPERLADPSCDFRCHKGWTIGYGTNSPTPATQPPCDGDTAIFPPTHSYRVSAKGIINVDSLVFDGEPVTSKAFIPEYQMTPAASALHLFLADNSNCFAAGTVKNFRCLCQSTCADPPTQLTQDAELRNAVRDAAEADINNRQTELDLTFNVTIFVTNVLAAMGGTTDAKTQLQCLLGTDVARQAAVTHFITDLQQALPGATVNNLQATYDADTNAVNFVSTSVKATRLLTSRASNTNGDLVSWWPTGPVSVSTEPKLTTQPLAAHLFHALLHRAVECAVGTEHQAVDDAFDNCPAASASLSASLCGLLRSIQTLSLAPTTVIPDLLTAWADYVAEPEDTRGNFAPNLTELFYAKHEDAAAELVAALAAALLADSNLGTALEGQANITGSAVAAWQAALANVLAPFPSHSTFRAKHTVSVTVGMTMPQSDLNRMVGEDNQAQLKAYLLASLVGVPPIISVTENSIKLEIEGTGDSTSSSSRRRRAATSLPTHSGQASAALVITFEYEMLQSSGCTVGSTSIDCPLLPGSPSFAVLQSVLNDLVATYTVAVPVCYNLDAGANITCIVQGITDCSIWAASGNTLRNNVRTVVKTLATCPSGGLCSTDYDAAYFNAVTDEVIAARNGGAGSCPVHNGGSSGASSSASGAATGPAIGGAVGAVVVVAVLILLIVRRRRSAPARTKTVSDRDVVAFENPMYDDPADNTAATYDEVAGDEGLYDQPAYGALDTKTNPLYQSNENLAIDEPVAMEDASGYLDVAPEEIADE